MCKLLNVTRCLHIILHPLYFPPPPLPCLHPFTHPYSYPSLFSQCSLYIPSSRVTWSPLYTPYLLPTSSPHSLLPFIPSFLPSHLHLQLHLHIPTTPLSPTSTPLHSTLTHHWPSTPIKLPSHPFQHPILTLMMPGRSTSTILCRPGPRTVMEITSWLTVRPFLTLFLILSSTCHHHHC